MVVVSASQEISSRIPIFIKGLAKGKGTPFDLEVFGIFDMTSLMMDFV